MHAKQAVILDQQTHLELLCMRAAVERESLVLHHAKLRLELIPKQWLHNMSDMSGGQLMETGISFAVQYPYLTSALSSLLIRRRWRTLKWAGVAIVTWQAICRVKEHNG